MITTVTPTWMDPVTSLCISERCDEAIVCAAASDEDESTDESGNESQDELTDCASDNVVDDSSSDDENVAEQQDEIINSKPAPVWRGLLPNTQRSSRARKTFIHLKTYKFSSDLDTDDDD